MIIYKNNTIYMCLKIFEHVDCQQLWSYECVLQWKLVDMMMPKDILDD